MTIVLLTLCALAAWTIHCAVTRPVLRARGLA